MWGWVWVELEVDRASIDMYYTIEWTTSIVIIAGPNPMLAEYSLAVRTCVAWRRKNEKGTYRRSFL